MKILVRAFIYFHTLCLRAANALTSLRLCADSSELSLLVTKISCTVTFKFVKMDEMGKRERERERESNICLLHSLYNFVK